MCSGTPAPGVLYGVLQGGAPRGCSLRYFTPCASTDLAPYADLVLYVSRDDGMLAGVRAKVSTHVRGAVGAPVSTWAYLCVPVRTP